MSERDFRAKFNSSAEVLHKLLEDKAGPVSNQYLRWKLWLNWKDVVGETVAANAEPVSYRHGVLWLWVRSSVWMHQMTYMVEPIKNSINQKFKEGFITEIKLTLDRRNTPHADDVSFKSNIEKFVKAPKK